MSIAVIDMSPELFWYVSGTLASLELPLKHYPDSKQAYQIIAQEMPKIVILNGDDASINVAEFIGKMRNHIFARHTYFIVFTSNTSLDHRRSLVISGAAQVFFRELGKNPDPKKFLNVINWLLDIDKIEAYQIDNKMIPFSGDAELHSWGRLGWITATQCMIETNVDLNPGESIAISSPLFDDLEIKEPRFICLEKNQVGRYYQYANSLLGKIETKHTALDLAKIKNWIKNNGSISKSKPVKLVFFEPEGTHRDNIAKVIKMDQRYCVRGYADIDNFDKILNYQLPNLVLINRNLIQKSKTQFEAIKKFMKTHFCFCITYAHDESLNIADFKKNYEFAMHLPTMIDVPLLESMISKLEDKMPKENSNEHKVIFNKHSVYSRASFHTPIKITDLFQEGLIVRLPYNLNNYCSMEIISSDLLKVKLPHHLFFRSVEAKRTNKTKDGTFHRLIFVGMTLREEDLIHTYIDDYKEPEE